MEDLVWRVNVAVRCVPAWFALPCHFSGHIQDYALPVMLLIMPYSCCSISAATDKP